MKDSNSSASDTILDRAVRVMDFVASRHDPSGFTEIMNELGVNRATLTKILKILCSHQMLEKAGGGYVIGSRPLIYAGTSPGQKNLLARCRPLMESLATRFGVTVILIRVLDNQSVCLDKVTHESAPAMREIGSVAGESLIQPWALFNAVTEGSFDDEELMAEFKKIAADTHYVRRVPEADEIRRMLDTCRQGVADDFGLIIPHARRFAAQVQDPAPTSSKTFLVAGCFHEADLDFEQLKKELY